MPSSNRSVQDRYGLTDAEAQVLMARTANGEDTDTAAQQIVAERVGPAATYWKDQAAANAAPVPSASNAGLADRIATLEERLAAADARVEELEAAVTAQPADSLPTGEPNPADAVGEGK